MNTLPIILTGDRPTGSLHLGHYVGSLRQRVALQQYHQQYVLIADLQGLTDNGSNPQKIRDNIPQVLADYLAVGIDPALTTICLQSALPALAELTVLYMNIVTVARVERNPTVKNEIAQKGFTRSLPVGFMAYPISQAADITAFKAEMVPVGDCLLYTSPSPRDGKYSNSYAVFCLKQKTASKKKNQRYIVSRLQLETQEKEETT